jgi:hypothetical protein
LLGGMTLFVLAIVGLLLWLVLGGVAGKQRGLVITNLRTDSIVVTLADGQMASFKPGESKTLAARKKDFPQAVRVTDPAGSLVYEQTVEYKTLADAEFRIAIGNDSIIVPAKPPSD